ncbi:MAG: FGGY-family carbohydrate kinase [Chloroflexota bacterium]
MAPSEQILAIDNGTQSVRAILFDLEGHMIAKSQVALIPYHAPQPGWAEHDPEYYWEKLTTACRQLWAMPEADKAAVVGVTLTTQRGTVVNVDQEGRPLRPAITWMDTRRTEGLPFIGGWWGLLFRTIGLKETIAYFQAEAEAVWIARHQPEIWEKTHKYLLLSGYLTHKLCHRFVDSTAAQVGYIPFDFKRFDWSAPYDWKWSVLDQLTPDLMPDLVPPGSLLGEITAAASDATGIPAGLPLVAAAADKACEVLGSGCLKPDIAALSFGTTATINSTQSRYIETIPLIPPYPSAVTDHYSLEVQVFRGFWLVNWFKEEFGQEEMWAANAKGLSPEFLLERLVEAVPPGAEGLLLQPYWSPGLKIPGPEALGAIIGWRDVHTRAHFYRAILEGIVFALREGGERIQARSRIPFSELRVSGGGSQSDAAMQIAADIFGLPALRPHLYETSALGAAIDAAVGLGLHADFEAAVAAMTRTGDRFEPRSDVHQLYMALFTDVYQQIYRQNRPLYRQIRKIFK